MKGIDERTIQEQWNAIAPEFERTRVRPWDEVVSFLDACGRSPLLDVGCGHGRHAIPAIARGLRCIGVDLSPAMLRAARRNRVEAVEASAAVLPFRNGAFASATCIATLHVIPGRAQRLAALKELARVLAANAPALVAVWSVEQARFENAAPWPGAEPGDVKLRWSEAGRSIDRYYHPYTRDELTVELERANFFVERAWGAKIGPKRTDNWLALVRSRGTKD